MSRSAYATDLSDAQWVLLEPFRPKSKPLGRNMEVSVREVVNAIFYINRAGCQWDMLPASTASQRRLPIREATSDMIAASEKTGEKDTS